MFIRWSLLFNLYRTPLYRYRENIGGICALYKVNKNAFYINWENQFSAHYFTKLFIQFKLAYLKRKIKKFGALI